MKTSQSAILNMMRRDIADCLEFGTSCSLDIRDILTEKLKKWVNHEDEQAVIEMETAMCLIDKYKIRELPLQDTFWYLKEVTLEHNDLSLFRLMVLSDAGISPISTIQFSMAKAYQVTFEEQALTLLCQGCFFPLDGRKSRRPRFLDAGSCKDDGSGRHLQVECEKLGIYLSVSVSSKNELNALRLTFQTAIPFRQCSVCGVSGSSDFFHACDKCGAVIYCRERCQQQDWEESHQEWCLQFKQFMTMEAEMADLPFAFASETTARSFDDKKSKEFLQNYSVFGRGLWRLESSASCQEDFVTDDVSMEQKSTDGKTDWHSLFGLDKEASLLQSLPKPPEKPLEGWSDYYSLRGFDTDSPIAVLLNFPLTLYYIISHLLPKDYNETVCRIQESKKICIHLIGAEKEVKMFSAFLECARLLSHLSVHIHLFGNNFEDCCNGEEKFQENLSFQSHKGFYHRTNHDHIPAPDLAVFFNGGIGAYKSYLKTVKYLTRRKIPFYYTDYGQASIAFSSTNITKCEVGRVSQPHVNPFRSPLRMSASDQNLPRYSNAFITCVTALC